ncbi:MAG: DUF805 domain-containing protein [Pseudomonadota bacterium]
MNLAEAIKSGFNNYVTFSGRASRSAYWFWVLFVFIAAVVASVIDKALFGGFDLLYVAVLLATFLPGLSVLVRRLHDTNRSGWWYWILLIPVAGWIALIVFLCLKGTPGDNRFGPDPLA